MRRLTVVTSVALVCLALFTVTLPAQDVDPLQIASATMGVARLPSVRFAAFGAAYSVGHDVASSGPAEKVIVTSYTAAYDYQTRRADVRLVRDDSAEVVESKTGPERQQELWSTPHGFLRAARAHGAVTRRTALGVEVVFEVAGRRYVGVVNERNEVDRVQTWIERPAGAEVLVETLYRDYEPVAGGGRFPTHIVRREGGRVALDLWVSAVQGNAGFE